MGEENASPMKKRPRLMIRSLRLENFKSYGGVVEVGPYHKNFSAIVGPNGSGKSNVIDAMLFVFGKRAKQMRLNKIAELIHNSDESKKIGSASVTVFMQEIIDCGEEEFEVVPNSQIELKRTVNQNSQSKYTVNGEHATFKDVQNLLGAKGIDLDNNRFLILQGEIEQISLLKPRAPSAHEDGLLEYLEDIIGTNKYVEMIDMKAKEVEEANEERVMKLTRVRAAEKERDALEGAKNEAEEYLAKEMTLSKKKLLMYRFRGNEVSKTVEQVQVKIVTLEGVLEKNREKKERIELEQQEHEKTLRVTREEHSEVAQELDRCRSEFAALERRDIQYREDIKHLKAKEKRLKASVAKEEKKSAEAMENSEKYEQEKEKLHAEEEQLRIALSQAEAELEKQFDRVKHSTAHFREEMESRQKEIMPYAALKEERAKDVEVTRAELEIAKETLRAPVKALEDAEEQLKQVQEEKEQLTTTRVEETKTELKAQKTKRSQLKATMEEKNEKSKRLGGAVHEAKKRVEEASSTASSNAALGKTEAELFKAAREGILQGLVGRLSELGTIDDRYDVAVGAAAGGPLRNIVVERADQAQDCVEYLRKNNLGRATFIILEKLEYLRRDMDAWKDGAKSKRLFDLIRVQDPMHRLAFYFALRDTLVAEDLDEATKLAYQPTRRNRVVTVAGQLIESSGAMTGGGHQAPRAHLGSRTTQTTSSSDLAHMKQQLTELVDALNKLRADINHLQAELKTIDHDIAQLEMSLEKMSMDLRSLNEREIELVNQLPQLQTAVKTSKSGPGDRKLQQLKGVLETKEAELAEAKAPHDKLEREISKLQEKILAAGGSPLQKAKERKEATSIRLEEVVSAIYKLTVMIDSTKSAAAKARKVASTTEGEIDETRRELSKSKEEFSKVEIEAVVVNETVSEAEDRLKKKSSVLKELQVEHGRLAKALSLAKSSEVDTQNQMADLTKALTDLDAKARQWERKIIEMRKEFKSLLAQRMADGGGEEKEEMEEDKDSDMEDGKDSSMEVDGVEDMAEDKIDGDEDLEELVFEDLQAEISNLEEDLKELKPNVNSIVEYKKKDKEYAHHLSVLDNITTRRDEARKNHEELKTQRHDEFMAGFHIITMKLKEMYQMITLGGDAELELVDSLDPFAEGIVFSVRPPKKSWKNIANLSGGEKTLSSLALVFALHHFKPTPLYFMDEIDAALDFKNVSIVANYVKGRTKDAQFIIISLRNNMFEMADRLVGIYKTSNATKSVTINPNKFKIPSAVSEPTHA